MNKMWDVICYLFSMPYEIYFSLLGLTSGIYIVLMGPVIFRFWIIPKVENRYRTILKINPTIYTAPFASYGMPPLEMSSYVFCKFMKWEKLNGLRNPQPGRFYFELKRINYDIHTASKAEIIMCSITMFFFFSMIISAIVVAMTVDK